MIRQETRIAVVTVSDRCFTGEEEDKSGPFILQYLKEKGHQIFREVCVADEFKIIQSLLVSLCESGQVDIVLTTGGTGFTDRDVTPEATKSILEKEAPGIVVGIITESIKFTPFAALSRPCAGIRNSTLIINLPGGLKAVKEGLPIIEPLFNHIVDQLRGDKLRVRVKHLEIQEPSKPLEIQISRPINSMDKSVVLGGFPYRMSPYEMIGVDEAVKKVMNELKNYTHYQSESIPIKDDRNLINRRLLKDVYSPVDIPPFPASIKDGYAVLSTDKNTLRKVIPTSITAGLSVNDMAIDTGWCIRINTGAPVPDGADAVVQVEDTEVSLNENGEEKEILFHNSPRVGQDIRKKGSDISKGEKVLTKGTKLGPIELGLLSSIGLAMIDVYKQPKVAVLSTGDELKDAGDIAGKGLIFDANRVTLISFLRKRGCEIIDLGIVRDEEKLLEAKIIAGLEKADILIASGGVSMGEKDFLKKILTQSLGCKLHFGRVNLKPGKPTTFATCVSREKKKLIFSLPGNPVSAFVTCYLFVAPVIDILSGGEFREDCSDLFDLHPWIKVRLCLDKDIKLDDRPEFLRVVVNFSHEIPEAQLIKGSQMSSRLMSIHNANALVMLPPRSEMKDYIITDGFLTKAILIT